MICFVFFIILLSRNGKVVSSPTFSMSFQESGSWSTEEWAKYKDIIPRMEEFTACHWQNIRFFSAESMNVWAYCITDDANGKTIKCTEIFQRSDPSSANRQIILTGYIHGGAIIRETIISSFRHRTWNHLCVGYSSLKGVIDFYFNGKVASRHQIPKGIVIPSSKEVLNASLIIGQEPDIIDGEFDVTQLFNGEISELNIWSDLLDEGDILDLAECTTSMKGNVMEWKKENFAMFQGSLKDIDNLKELFCTKDEMLVIFPQRHPLNIATRLCASHGGKIVTPKNKDQNDQVMNILRKHSTSCLNDDVPHAANRNIAAWLGLKYKDYLWYEVDDGKIIANVTYSNWNNRPNETVDTSCAFLETDGKWSFKTNEACYPNLILCVVCSFSEFPVITVNGLCDSIDYDWNYYIKLGEAHEISYYEGYKSYNILKDNDTWKFKPKNGGKIASNIYRKIEDADSYPVGRSTWNVYAPICENDKGVRKNISFSTCEFGKQFTCNSGRCITLYKRCDHVFDCEDRSDEEGCKLILRPDTYRKVQPPEPINRSEPLSITTEVEIVSIDSIDVINMVVGLTIKIRLKWRDPRLTFANLVRGGKNIVQPGTVQGLWIPLDYMIFENSIIGEIYDSPGYYVKVEAMDSSLPKDESDPIQNRLFSGANNTLYISERYRLKYRCKFWLRGFPFDRQNCKFVIQMKSDAITTISLTQANPPVRYDGPDVVEQFKMRNITVMTNTDTRRTSFNLTIIMDRVYTDQLITAFFPSYLLWLLAYMTLFISLDNFTDRIMVSVTALLVLAALLSSINSSLPDTSYFKYIDLWFLWYTTNIFLIASFHICLGVIEDELKVHPSTASHSHTHRFMIPGKKQKSKRQNINDVAKIIVPVIGFLFNIVYFYLQGIDNSNLLEYN